MTSSGFTVNQLALSGSAERLVGTASYTGGVDTVQIRNLTGNAVVYIGGSDVTSSNGFPLYAGDVWTIDTMNPRSIYVIGTATQRVAWAVLA